MRTLRSQGRQARRVRASTRGPPTARARVVPRASASRRPPGRRGLRTRPRETATAPRRRRRRSRRTRRRRGARASGKTPWRYCCAASVARAFFLSLLLISRAKSPEGQNFRRSRGDLRVLRFFQGRRRRRRVFLEEGLRGLPMVGCSANLCADGPCGSFPYVARNLSPWMGCVVRSALRELDLPVGAETQRAQATLV